MKLQLFIFICCVLQSIHGLPFNVSDEIIYPPDVAAGRIVGGKDAPDGAFPYQCSLQVNKRHNCGCSILTNRWLLTAAHCVEGHTLGSLDVLIGTNDLRNGGKYFELDKAYVHKGHNQPRFANDVAVIRVRGTIEFNDRVQPIEPSPEEVPDGAEVVLTGWGRLSTGGRLPERLQMIKLKALTTKSCRKTPTGAYVHDSHMCTFTRYGEGSCNGDSGGPLMYKNKVVGLVNFGFSCAKGRPDAHAKVAYLYDWIKEHTVE